jgi:hypothetical protein
MKNKRGVPKACVEQWLGFSYDEQHRVKQSDKQFITFAYPLINLKMDKDDVARYFSERGLPIPPRSVCNACFANGLNTYKEMYNNRPEDWQQAVNVDRAVRDWTKYHVKNPVYVSPTLVPLEELAINGFRIGPTTEENFTCDSGQCFL